MRYLVFFFLCVASVIGATFTISSSQNWSAISGGPPSSADNVNINGNVVLTVDVNNATCSRIDIGVTDNSGGNFATLQFATNSKLTVSSQVRLGGNTAARDGKLIMGPGSELAGAGQLLFNNGYWSTTATQESERWRYTMTGDVDTLATGPKQDVQLSYGSFIGTRIFKLYLQNTMGGATSQARFSHCIWNGCRDPIFGSTDSPNTTAITFDNCDFDNITVGNTITLRRATGGSGSFYMRHCTFQQSGAMMVIAPTTSTGFEVSDCVGQNAQVTNASTSGTMACSNNLWITNRNTVAAYNPHSGAAGSTITGDYFLGLAASDNYHCIVPSAGSGGSGTMTVTGCVLDAPAGGAYDDGDLIVSKNLDGTWSVENNLTVRSADLLAGTHTANDWTASYTIKNNTQYVGSGTNNRGVFSPEGYPTSGTVTIYSNLGVGSGHANDYFVWGGEGYGTQTVAVSDYNNVVSYYYAYVQAGTLVISSGNTGKTVPGANDTANAPRFFGPTRTAAIWNSIFGSGTSTAEALATYFLLLNGYRGASNYDQGGTATGYLPSAMTAWVRYGYSPTNLQLRGTGQAGTDQGAMPVRTIAGSFF